MPRSIHLCHQKPNPARNTVPLRCRRHIGADPVLPKKFLPLFMYWYLWLCIVHYVHVHCLEISSSQYLLYLNGFQEKHPLFKRFRMAKWWDLWLADDEVKRLPIGWNTPQALSGGKPNVIHAILYLQIHFALKFWFLWMKEAGKKW